MSDRARSTACCVQHSAGWRAHLPCTHQVKDEYRRILEIAERFYSVFGLKYRLRLGTRPEAFIGESRTWDEAERVLREILDDHVGAAVATPCADGDGALRAEDRHPHGGRHRPKEWQMGTISRTSSFRNVSGACTQRRKANARRRWWFIVSSTARSSALSGSDRALRRTASLRLAPPRSRWCRLRKRVRRCRDLTATLRRLASRARTEESSESLSAKIRSAQLAQIPYMAVLGKKEVANGSVAVRFRDGKQVSMSLAAFIGSHRQHCGESLVGRRLSIRLTRTVVCGNLHSARCDLNDLTHPEVSVKKLVLLLVVVLPQSPAAMTMPPPLRLQPPSRPPQAPMAAAWPLARRSRSKRPWRARSIQPILVKGYLFVTHPGSMVLADMILRGRSAPAERRHDHRGRLRVEGMTGLQTAPVGSAIAQWSTFTWRFSARSTACADVLQQPETRSKRRPAPSPVARRRSARNRTTADGLCLRGRRATGDVNLISRLLVPPGAASARPWGTIAPPP